jgi:hypothetical protein
MVLRALEGVQKLKGHEALARECFWTCTLLVMLNRLM